MQFINFNGQLIPTDQPIHTADSRLSRYGDGLFESIRMFNGQLPFLNYHYQRLLYGIQLLNFEIPSTFSLAFMQQEIERLCSQKGNWRIRFSLFRKNGGLYTPINNQSNFLVEIIPLKKQRFTFNRKGLKLGLYLANKLPCTPLSNLKSSNSLTYILASQFVKDSKLDTCLILNSKNRIAETNHSNLFLIIKKTLITPKLTEGCIDGTMRKIVLEIAAKNHLKIKERNVPLELLNESEEIFVTNAIRGIQWVKEFEGKQYQNTISKKLYQQLNQLITNG